MTQPFPPVQFGDHDPPMPPPEVLSRVGARVLDPATAVVFDGQRIRPTVYLADQLLMRLSNSPTLASVLGQAAASFGLRVEVHDPISAASSAVARLRPNADDAAVVVDAWPVLQKARRLAQLLSREANGDDPRNLGLELNHLMYMTPMTPLPYDDPHPYDAPGSPYADLAYRGPQPVALVLGTPKRSNDESRERRRPIVAVVDTGCGIHPDLKGVVRVRQVPKPVGAVRTARAAAQQDEYHGDPNQPLDGLRHNLAGHGSFACGLVRQACPAADIVAIPVIEPDGTIPKGNLAAALDHIASLVEWSFGKGRRGLAIDVVSISMGHYHEHPDDLPETAQLRVVLKKLTDLGVIVVMSAGNDATSRKMYPAALAERSNAASNLLVSVGALNPDGSSVARFSNSGKWVTTWERGAAVVSTMPTNFQFSRQSIIRTTDLSGRERSTVDGDNFKSGYAIASGTSFATPIVAGRIAGLLDATGALDHCAVRDRELVVEQVLAEAELSAPRRNGHGRNGHVRSPQRLSPVVVGGGNHLTGLRAPSAQ